MTWYTDAVRNAVLAVFDPPNSGNLESRIALKSFSVGAINELEKMTGGKTHLELVQLGHVGCQPTSYCTVDAKISDGKKVYVVFLSVSGTQVSSVEDETDRGIHFQ